jgi:hypothetical protein
MKTAFFLFCVLCASAAFGQNVSAGTSALSAQPIPIVVPTHPEHASQRALNTEQSLFETSAYTYARGERPLWEVAPKIVEVPLGDIARDLRKDHAIARKSAAVFENQ